MGLDILLAYVSVYLELVPREIRRGHPFLWNWSYVKLQAAT